MSTPKYKSFATTFERQMEADVLRPGQPLPPIRSLMSSSNLSLATVMKGLKLLEERGAVNRHEGRGYFVADQGRPLPGVSQIAFITATLEKDTNDYLKGFAGALDENKFALATYASHGELENFRSLIEQVVRTRPSGIILNSVPEYLLALNVAALKNSGVPTVVMGPAVKGLNCDRVFNMGRENGRKITRYLLSRGHRDFAMFTMNAFDDPDCAFAGVRETLKGAGIELTPDRIFTCKSMHGFAEPADPYIDAYEEMKRVLAKGLHFKTLICCHDYPAVGALRAILDVGLRVPEDVTIASSVKCSVEGASPMNITTVGSLRREQGRIAVELLLKRIGGNTSPAEIHYIHGDIIPGETV